MGNMASAGSLGHSTRGQTVSVKCQLTSKQQFIISNCSILDVLTDAVVTSTDTRLGFDGLVSQVLLEAAGDALKQECASKAPIQVGNVAVTKAGRMRCKNILHVVLPNYDGPRGKAEKIICSTVEKCLEICSNLNLKSVAFPSIGAGNLKYPEKVVARCLLETTASFLQKNQSGTSLELIHFVIYMPHTHKAFLQHFLSLASTFPHTSLFARSPVLSIDLTSTLELVMVYGDIADDDSNVIVNTTNKQLDLAKAGSVSKAILGKGGQSLQSACNEVRLDTENVAITRATGQLRCHEVFHIHFNGKENLYVQNILSCLVKAEERKHQSIAFPAVGTGFTGYPPVKAATGTVEALQKFVTTKPRNVKKIKMVLFQQDVHKVFAEIFTQSLKTENWLSSVEASSEDVSGSNVMVVMHEKLLDDLLQQNLQVAEKQTASGSDSQQYEGGTISANSSTSCLVEIPEKSYRMTSVPRGYCYIINNIYFRTLKERNGSIKDAKALGDLFGDYLGFAVRRFDNQSSKEMCTLMARLQNEDQSKMDCLVVAVLSHGTDEGAIYGTDETKVSVGDITSHFTGTNCPTLKGKPKVFILQACRGNKYDRGVELDSADGPGDINELDKIALVEDEIDHCESAGSIPEEADFVFAYPTTSGHVSFRNQQHGSRYIRTLTKVMREQADREDFLSMLTEVNREVADEDINFHGENYKQMPAPTTTLRYKLYFPPISSKK